jgi:hypothetical protein
VADCKWPSRARIPGGLVPGTVARGRLAFLAARTVTAPPGRDMANSATSPILQQRQPELQVVAGRHTAQVENWQQRVEALGSTRPLRQNRRRKADCAAAGEATNLLKSSFATTFKGTEDYSAKVLEFTNANISAGVKLALSAGRSPERQ